MTPQTGGDRQRLVRSQGEMRALTIGRAPGRRRRQMEDAAEDLGRSTPGLARTRAKTGASAEM